MIGELSGIESVVDEWMIAEAAERKNVCILHYTQ